MQPLSSRASSYMEDNKLNNINPETKPPSLKIKTQFESPRYITLNNNNNNSNKNNLLKLSIVNKKIQTIY